MKDDKFWDCSGNYILKSLATVSGAEVKSVDWVIGSSTQGKGAREE